MICNNDLPFIQHILIHPHNTPPFCSETDPKISSKSDEIVDDIIDEIVLIENVTVKFCIPNSQEIIAQVYPNRLRIGDIKKDIARKFEVDVEILVFKQNGRVICDECLLLETVSDEFGIHEFHLFLDVPTPTDDQTTVPKLDINVYYE